MSLHPPHATAGYLAHVARDWAVGSFATAGTGTFALAPHRFELDGATVRRRRLPRRSREAADPLALARDVRRPVAWVRSDTVTLLADTPSGSVAYDQEVVEVIAMGEDEILATAAAVVRIPGFPPCLGRFGAMA